MFYDEIFYGVSFNQSMMGVGGAAGQLAAEVLLDLADEISRPSNHGAWGPMQKQVYGGFR